MTTQDIFPETEGATFFSEEKFASGGFRLGPARISYSTTSALWDNKRAYDSNDYSAVLERIIANPASDDVSYYYLGWIAENRGYYAAAYEYYNLSRILFDFDVVGASNKFGATLKRDAFEHIISACGYSYRDNSGYNTAQLSCPDDLSNLIDRGIASSENHL